MPRVAVVQAAPVAFDRDATLERIEALTADAARAGAQVVVFPEAFIGGYPKGHDFGARVGSRTDAGREWFRRYHAAAVAVGDDACTRLGELARHHGCYLVVGAIEKDGGTLYCSALIFTDSGELAGVHRKLVPTASERIIWGRGSGADLLAVQSPHGTLGAVICWENYMPLLRTAMYRKGVSIYCAPTVDDRDSWIPTMQHIAVEGRCFVLSCCQFATRGDFPADYDTAYGDDPTTVMIRGGSCIVSPFGEVLAGPIYGEQAVLTAEIDPAEIIRGKYDLDVVGHYGRPDVFRLDVVE